MCQHVCLHPSRLLAEKRSELGEQVSKLRNGLFKINDTREKVKAMSVELEEAKKQVAVFQIQCDEFLSIILEQTTEANKQKNVSITKMFACAHSYRIDFMYFSSNSCDSPTRSLH